MKKFKFIVLLLLVAVLTISLVACDVKDPTPPPPESKDIKVDIVAAGFFSKLYNCHIGETNDAPYADRTIASFSDTIENQIVAHVEFTDLKRDFSTLQYKVIINDSIQSIYYATPYAMVIDQSACERYLGINIFEGEFWNTRKKWSRDKVEEAYFNNCKLSKGSNHTCVTVINLPYKDPAKQIQFSPKTDKIVFVVQEVDLAAETTTVLAQCEIK